MKGFFSRPHDFSFKDLLAIVFSGSFLYYCFRALSSGEAMDLVKALIPLIGIILGGYFVQESASAYFQRSQSVRQDTGGNLSRGERGDDGGPPI